MQGIRRVWVFALVLTLVFSFTLVAAAQDLEPSVTVQDQSIVDGTVTIAEVVAAEDGWIVIHAQAGGGIGPVIGHAAVSTGTNTDVVVEIDESMATSTLYAMLHIDAGEIGTYEFPGPDGPVVVDGAPLAPPFTITAAEEEVAEATATPAAEEEEAEATPAEEEEMAEATATPAAEEEMAAEAEATATPVAEEEEVAEAEEEVAEATATPVAEEEEVAEAEEEVAEATATPAAEEEEMAEATATPAAEEEMAAEEPEATATPAVEEERGGEEAAAPAAEEEAAEAPEMLPVTGGSLQDSNNLSLWLTGGLTLILAGTLFALRRRRA